MHLPARAAYALALQHSFQFCNLGALVTSHGVRSVRSVLSLPAPERARKPATRLTRSFERAGVRPRLARFCAAGARDVEEQEEAVGRLLHAGEASEELRVEREREEERAAVVRRV